MMEIDSNTQKFPFSANLFWDVDPTQLDLNNHKRFIIQRVIEFGTLNDWKFIKSYYGIAVIGREMTQIRSLDDITLSFISLVTGIRKEDFRCYITKQSLPPHWNF